MPHFANAEANLIQEGFSILERRRVEKRLFGRWAVLNLALIEYGGDIERRCNDLIDSDMLSGRTGIAISAAVCIRDPAIVFSTVNEIDSSGDFVMF
jgi:hypothetical protein